MSKSRGLKHIRKKLPGLKARRNKDGKKVLSKFPKTPMKEAVPPEIFDTPPVRDASVPLNPMDPPDYLDAEGRWMWKIAGRALAARGELTEDHMPGLRGVAYRHQCREKLMRQGGVTTASEEMAWIRLLAEFGLTPSSNHLLDPTGKRRAKPFETPPVEKTPETTGIAELMGNARAAGQQK